MEDYQGRYAEFLRKYIQLKRPLSVVFDCSNGPTALILKKLFAIPTEINTTIIHDLVDGNFPGHGPDPTKPNALDDLKKTVLEKRADLGIIFDADGDRMFAVDDRGREVNSDIAAALISEVVPGDVVVDVTTGYQAREMIEKEGKKLIESRVGHAFIKQAMQQMKAAFGAESSGHYYFKDFFGADSGIFAAIQLINRISKETGPISVWIDALPPYAKLPLTNFSVNDKPGVLKRIEEFFRAQATIISKTDGLKMEFGDGIGAWWCIVRPSNTENVLRLLLEVKNPSSLKAHFEEIKNLIEN